MAERDVPGRPAVTRHLGESVQMAAQQVPHKQRKRSREMNLQIQHVISVLTRTTGLAIVNAILAGERDPAVLARLPDPRIRATAETIQKSRVGNWQPEHLFALGQSRLLYQSYRQQIAACDQEIEKPLGAFAPRVDPAQKPGLPEPGSPPPRRLECVRRLVR
jgi:transposase